MSRHSVSDLSSTGEIYVWEIHFGYPFGINGSGCGEPDFQLNSCEADNVPVINIGGNEYHILDFSFSPNSYTSGVVRIVNDNMWEDKCNISGNYSQFWMSASSFHFSADVYSNLSLWKDCNNQGTDYHISGDICGWHYGWSAPLPPCKSIQLPFAKSVSYVDPQQVESDLKEGFEISWFDDPIKNAKCVACLESNGKCGYNTSTPAMFLCHCPNGKSRQDNCIGDQDTGGRNNSAIIIDWRLAYSMPK